MRMVPPSLPRTYWRTDISQVFRRVRHLVAGWGVTFVQVTLCYMAYSSVLISLVLNFLLVDLGDWQTPIVLMDNLQSS